jgi:four helix bundle protein
MEVTEQGCNKLIIYKKAHELAIQVHKMTFSLPKFEMYEEGVQIRKSTKSVSNNIVEGYALRKYKNEYLHYLYRVYASSEETIEHLKFLTETNSLIDDKIYKKLIKDYYELNRMLFSFITTIEKEYTTPNFLLTQNRKYMKR